MVIASWHVLELAEPAATCPWLPTGAQWVQSGVTGPGRIGMPDGSGRWWSVLARWDDQAAAEAARADADRWGQAWHVLLDAKAYRGDVGPGQAPFGDLPEAAPVAGPAAVVTFAGLGADPGKLREFLSRFGALADDVGRARGALAGAVLAPTDGPVLTFSAWTSLRAATTWAYSGELHSAVVARQEEVTLVERSGFLRCAVLGSAGTLLGHDPLAALVPA